MNPCWILCLPRSGSTYLSNMLNNLNAFPAFDMIHPQLCHALNNKPGILQKNHAFGEWLRLYTPSLLRQCPPPFTKAIRSQYLSLSLDGSKIASILPGIRFISLKRRDTAKQAVSIYIAHELNQYHVYNQRMLRDYRQKTFVINPRKLIRVYRQVIAAQKTLDIFSTSPTYEIYYEDILIDPMSSLTNIIKWLGMNPVTTDIDRSINMTKQETIVMDHPSKTECMAILGCKLL